LTGGSHFQSGTWMPFRGGGVHPIVSGSYSPFIALSISIVVVAGNGENRPTADIQYQTKIQAYCDWIFYANTVETIAKISCYAKYNYV